MSGRLPLAAGRAKVWVLMGGEGGERQASLASGLNVVAKLKQYAHLEVSWRHRK